MEFKKEANVIEKAKQVAAKEKPKVGRPKGVKAGQGKKPPFKKAAPGTKKARTSRRKPHEREFLRVKLVEYFGNSKVEKRTITAKNMVELDTVLTILRKQMEQELAVQEIELEDYYAKIDEEYKKVGRPKSVFNWRELDYLCSIGCNLDEIAGFFQITKDALKRRVKDEFGISFNEYYETKSQGIKVALRRAQIAQALSGDTAMLKFLGKNVLGQKEKIDFDGEVKVNSWVDMVNNLENKGKDAEQSNNEEPKILDIIHSDE